MSAFVAPAVRVPERVVGGKALNARRSLIIRHYGSFACFFILHLGMRRPANP